MKTFSSLKIMAIIAISACITPLLFTSTGCSAKADDTDTATYTPTSDTLSELLGKVYGMTLLQQIQEVNKTSNKKIDIENVCKGVELVLEKRHPASFLDGIDFGVSISQTLDFLDSISGTSQTRLFDLIVKCAGDTHTIDNEKLKEIATKFDETMRNLTSLKDQSQKDASIKYALTNFPILVGQNLHFYFTEYNKANTQPLDTASFFNGARAVAGKKQPMDYIGAIGQGLQFYQIMARYESQGVNIRRSLFLSTLTKILKDGKFNEQQLKTDSEELQKLSLNIQAKYEKAEEERLSKSDEAIQNTKTGEAHIAKLKKENPDVKLTENGVAYQIHTPGKGNHPNQNDTVVVSYVGKHLNGTEFDKNDNIPFPLASVVPGFSEGLRQLNKGAKATIWIPGKLGYGAKGQPYANIGPNEMLQFDVTVVDIKPAK